MTTVELFDLGRDGINSDVPAHLIPPEGWSSGRNVRFNKAGVSQRLGYAQVFGTLSGVPEFIMNLPATTGSFWLYTSLTSAYVYEGGVHTDITRTAGAYTASNGKSWNGTVLGGIPILNNGVDVPQYWPTISPATKLVNLINWPAALRAKVIRAFGPYLVALNLTDGGVALSQAIQWSHKADPGTVPTSWDYTSPIVDAGRTELTDIEGGVIVDAVLLGNQLVIYKATSIHTLRFIGGTDIFAPDLILPSSGILAAGCACAYDKGSKHFVVTPNDIITHSGGREGPSIADDRVRDTIFSELDSTAYTKAFVFENPLRKECWFCYPTTGQTYPNQAAIWNYKDNNWTFQDTVNFVSASSGTITDAASTTWAADTETWDDANTPWSVESLKSVVVVNRAKALKLDSGMLFDTVVPTAYVERVGLAIDGVDRNKKPRVSYKSRKLCTRIWPKLHINGAVLMNVRMGAQETREDDIVWTAPQTFDAATQKYLDFTVNGRLLAIRFETTSAVFWQLEGVDYEVEILGYL